MSKKLYAILWVDDYGSKPLSKKDVDWYHRNAGPVSFLLEKDDRYPWTFKKILGGKFIDPSLDYLSHHLHPDRWQGSRWIKRICDYIQLYWWLFAFIGRAHLSTIANKRYRPLHGLMMAIGLALVIYVYFVNKPIFAILLFGYCILALVAGLWFYWHSSQNWFCSSISDLEWNKSVLRSVKKEWEGWGYQYPAVIRHGYNLPPAGTMEFYMSEMGVLADASSTTTPYEGYQQKGVREIKWGLMTPYYASLKRDYNIAWDGRDEEDMGLLELPVVMGNIPFYGFTSIEKEVIDKLPENGLVAVYIHPGDNFSVIKEWVDYLKRNYDVEFVRADQYLKLYMKQSPRPLLVKSNLEVFWAFKKGDKFCSIRKVDEDIVSLEVMGEIDTITQCQLGIRTEAPIPIIWFEAKGIEPIDCQLDMDVGRGGVSVKNVMPGIYKLRVSKATSC